MGARAEQLASKFEQSCREFESTVDRLSDAQWKTVTGSENWPVAVVAHHVAGGHAAIAGLVELVAKAKPLPHMTMDMIHEGNAKHAQEFAAVSKAETLTLLKTNGAKAAAMVRGLSDSELDRSASILAGMPAMTAAQAIEGILINHTNEHLGTIRASVGAK
jgi:hypothetical protein